MSNVRSYRGEQILQYEDGEWNEINQTEDGLEQF